MKKILTVFCLFIFAIYASGYKKPDVYVINPVNDASMHNNKGLEYIDEKAYYAAIQEFKIAISLNPNSQATAVYYYNLGETYMKLGFYKYAQDCLERSLNLYPMNFEYYKNLAICYEKLNLIDSKINFYSSQTKNPFNMILLGLLYIKKGDLKRGIIKLDEFSAKEPDLIITGAVKNYIKTIVP